MKNYSILMGGLVLMLSACDPKPATFSATTTNFGPNAVIAINDVATNKALKVINIENKAQTFKANQPTNNFEELMIQDGGKEKKYWIYLDNGETKMQLDGKNLYFYPIKEASSIEGKTLIDYYKLKDERSKDVLDSLEMAKTALDHANPSTVAELARSLDHWQAKSASLDLDIIKDFAKKSPDSKVSAFLLTRLPGIDDSPQIFKGIYDGLSEDVRTSEIGKELESQIATAMLMSVGSTMPNIEGTTPSGEAFNKTKVLKKVNLIIAWTSYSGKSATNNKELVDLYQKFKDKDVQFISVSYDKDKDAWLNGIKAQNLTWPQYSDLKGAKSPNAKNISNYSITYFAIVDKNGKVLTGHDLSMDFVGDELEKALGH
ncbi:peroxiredoxin [Pedobacter sp. UYP30]|uniref:TlpA family protein disulfide reductase n=1 Tax=Pedobacter sp. UYP30 TaxID=1756400 RepID=UPI0033988163